MTHDEAKRMVDGATDLDELLAALQEIEQSVRRVDDEEWTDGDLAQRVDELVDITSLPTYGGEDPYHTGGVWSWDATRQIAGEGPWSAMRVEPRPDGGAPDLSGDAEVDGVARTVRLTPDASEACGHLAGEGGGGGPEETAERHRIRDVVRGLADATGEAWEIYAQDTDLDDWLVDVVEPDVRR